LAIAVEVAYCWGRYSAYGKSVGYGKERRLALCRGWKKDDEEKVREGECFT
jgi:hypothetical protein